MRVCVSMCLCAYYQAYGAVASTGLWRRCLYKPMAPVMCGGTVGAGCGRERTRLSLVVATTGLWRRCLYRPMAPLPLQAYGAVAFTGLWRRCLYRPMAPLLRGGAVDAGCGRERTCQTSRRRVARYLPLPSPLHPRNTTGANNHRRQ